MFILYSVIWLLHMKHFLPFPSYVGSESDNLIEYRLSDFLSIYRKVSTYGVFLIKAQYKITSKMIVQILFSF